MQTLYECKTDISVIIPVYNLEHFLQPMLDSLKHQELGDYTAEVLFVLNNCTDNSEVVIRDSGIDCTILYCTKQGCGPARNTALDVASGDYIWFMDGDDWLLSNTAIKDALDKAKAEDLNILRIPFKSNGFYYNYFSMVWQYLLRRDYICEFRFPDYQPGEDDAFMAGVLTKYGTDRYNFLCLPCMGRPQYYYNYKRIGSNMYRFEELRERI